MSQDRPQKILIIDDEKDVHHAFRRLLQSDQLNVLSAESGDEGIKTARAESPDLIVMDIRMGQSNGLRRPASWPRWRSGWCRRPSS